MPRNHTRLVGSILCLLLLVLSGQTCPPEPAAMMPVPMPGPSGPPGPPGPPGSDATVIAGDGLIFADGEISLDTAFTNDLYWNVDGNVGTAAADNFLGTTDDAALEFRVNGERALRLVPTANGPNIVGGFGGNAINDGVVAGTIAGGGPADANDAAGTSNRVTDDFGFIGGGAGNQAGSDDADTTNGNFATVSGGRANAASGAFATIGGGRDNSAEAETSTIGGGSGNTASGTHSSIAGGLSNAATANLTTIGGGFANDATEVGATVGGGQINTASGFESTVGGGESNEASGAHSTIAGGCGNIADGFGATVPGGFDNEAARLSFAAGFHAKATLDGSFVWADSTDKDFPSATEPNFSPAEDQFLVRASAGALFVTAVDPDSGDSLSGVELIAGGGAWNPLCDRNAKENFARVDCLEILRKLVAVPIETWNYKTQDDSIRHLGPMAQDFHAAFGLGRDNRRICTIDADGVALAAIQGLHAMLKAKDEQLAEQQRQIDALAARLDALASRVAAPRTQPGSSAARSTP